MLEILLSKKISDFDLKSKNFKTNPTRMEDFNTFDDEIDSLTGHYNNTNVKLVHENVKIDSPNINMELSSVEDPKEPPDKSDFESFLGSSSDSKTVESDDHTDLLFSEDAQTNKNDPQAASESVASLTSACEENWKLEMEKYTEEALKTLETKNQLQLRLEEELNALSQDDSKPMDVEESKPDSKNIPVSQPETSIALEPEQIFPFEQKQEEEYVSFTIPKEELEDVKVENVTDPREIIQDILDEIIPAPLDPVQIMEDIIDSLVSKVTLKCQPPSSLFNTNAPPPSTSTPPPFVPLPSKRIRGKIYPPTFPPMERPGRVTNRLEFIRKKVLPAMFNHKDSWPFKTPVDAIKLNIPDYHNIVRNPMDLGTIKKRLVNKYYWNAQECQNDFKLMFGNCYLYNKPEYDIFVMCKELEKAYDKKIETMKAFSELDEELEKGFAVQKGKRKKLPGEGPVVKRACYGKTYNKVKEQKMFDFEDEIPVAQVHMPFHLAKKLKRARLEEPESSSEESEEESEESESDDEEERMINRSFPSHLKSYVTSNLSQTKSFVTSTPVTGGAKPSEKRQDVKHLCKYCSQPFRSRTVRDMHEKAKHQGPSLDPSPQQVIKKVPPLKLNLKKPNNSLQIVPVKQEVESPQQSLRNGPQNFPNSSPNLPPASFKKQLQQTEKNNANAFHPGSFPTQPYSDTDMMNFVDKKHKAMSKQKQQRNNQSAKNYYRKPPQPKVQNSSKSSSISSASVNNSSISSIPEELLFPDTTPSLTPNFAKMAPAGARVGVRTNSLTGDINSPPVPVYHNDSRPSNIISPPIQKFPKLSPDSGFPGSPDLMDPCPPHPDTGVISKSLGKLPGHPDVGKYPHQIPNPSIIKHTDPRAAAGMHQRPQQQPPAGVMMTSNNSKIQRRFSSSSPASPQLSDPGLSPRMMVPGQTVINRKSVESDPGFIQQRRTSGGQIVGGVKNGSNSQMMMTGQPGPVQGGRPSIVRTNVMQQQQQLSRLTPAAMQQQQQGVVRPPSAVLQQQQQQQQLAASRIPSVVLQQQQQQQQSRQPAAVLRQDQQQTGRPPAAVLQQNPGRPPSAVLQQGRPPSAVLQQASSRPPSGILQQATGRPPSAVLQQTAGRPPSAVLQQASLMPSQVLARLPQQPVSRQVTSAAQVMSRPPPAVMQHSAVTSSRPPPAVMSALQGPRPISLQSRNDQQIQPRNVISVPLKLPTQPLPPQHQPAPVQQQTKSNNLDVLAQTLKLSEISSDLDFDFEPAEPVRLGGGSSMIPPEETQELRLEDLKHLRDSVPKVVNNGGDAFISQLLDVSSITYQDVISAADTLTVYPGPTEAEQIIFSSSSSSFIGSSPVTMVQSSRPPNSVLVSSLDASSVLFAPPSSSSNSSAGTNSSFSGDLVNYSDTDLINIQSSSSFSQPQYRNIESEFFKSP